MARYNVSTRNRFDGLQNAPGAEMETTDEENQQEDNGQNKHKLPPPIIMHGQTGNRKRLVNEIKNKVKTPVGRLNENPLEVWSDYKQQFPNLYKLSYKCLTLVASSVPSERLFSKASQVLNQQRNRIQGKRKETKPSGDGRKDIPFFDLLESLCGARPNVESKLQGIDILELADISQNMIETEVSNATTSMSFGAAAIRQDKIEMQTEQDSVDGNMVYMKIHPLEALQRGNLRAVVLMLTYYRILRTI
ncbi:hypothetical protein CBL_12846 [Carabus blaptoides fortunei]